MQRNNHLNEHLNNKKRKLNFYGEIADSSEPQPSTSAAATNSEKQTELSCQAQYEIEKMNEEHKCSQCEKYLCGICYEREITSYFHECGHSCCKECAFQSGNDVWFETMQKCPFCRRHSSKISPLYFN